MKPDLKPVVNVLRRMRVDSIRNGFVRFAAVSFLLAVVLCARGAGTNATPSEAGTNRVAEPTLFEVLSAANADAELRRIMDEDDKAQEEAGALIRDDRKFAAQGGGLGKEELSLRIESRYEAVRKKYADFLKRNPRHVQGHIAYGSLLNDLQDETGAAVEWERARELDPANPAPWNNLALHYLGRGMHRKACEYFEKAISLDPKQAGYYRSLAGTIMDNRAQAAEYYQLSPQGVLDKAVALLRKSLELNPDQFTTATELASVYYACDPPRPDDALKAWQAALALAGEEVEREGVYVHLARVNMQARREAEARRWLNQITNAAFQSARDKIEKGLAPTATNAPSVKQGG